MMRHVARLLAAYAVATSVYTAAQTYTPGDATTLAAALVPEGSGLTVSGATLTGASDASGLVDLTGSTHALAALLGKAVVLSSGSAQRAAATQNTGSSFTVSNGQPGSPLIAESFDAVDLKFTLTSTAAGFLTFQYLFASEEYNEYVGSGFNDAFLLLVNGINVATVPSSGDQVSVNNVNNGKNQQFYLDNSNGHLSTEYDGLTTLLTTTGVVVTPNTPLTIELVVADVADESFDSTVYLKVDSFKLCSGCAQVDECHTAGLCTIDSLGNSQCGPGSPLSGTPCQINGVSGGTCQAGACTAPPLTCNGATASQATLWSPNGKFSDPISITGLQGDTVSSVITKINQNEATSSNRGDSCPDAQGIGTATVQLRAQRTGQGKGRIYSLAFTATDKFGQTCQGIVKVCVPHDQGRSTGQCDALQTEAATIDSTVC